ncbi:hypothetical protein BJX65DRAFT_309894 [Aspergillus insuetus]
MSYPRDETTDRTLESKSYAVGGQHWETDAALEPVIKPIEPKAHSGDDRGPQQVNPPGLQDEPIPERHTHPGDTIPVRAGYVHVYLPVYVCCVFIMILIYAS